MGKYLQGKSIRNETEYDDEIHLPRRTEIIAAAW
ncbi:hypothetical protein N184_16935 [Sinorhizobium sp. GL28]|nr:hypothetical protein N184_16935 [Sinorhizobium sp. GL28]